MVRQFGRRPVIVILLVALFSPLLAPGHPAHASGEAAVAAWFDCEECEDGQLARVTAFRESVLPLLERAAVEGAGESQVATARAHYTRLYLILRDPRSESIGAPTVGLRDFVGRYLSALKERVQVRAAIAIVEISGPGGLVDLPEPLRREAMAAYNAMRQASGPVLDSPRQGQDGSEDQPRKRAPTPPWRR